MLVRTWGCLCLGWKGALPGNAVDLHIILALVVVRIPRQPPHVRETFLDYSQGRGLVSRVHVPGVHPGQVSQDLKQTEDVLKTSPSPTLPTTQWDILLQYSTAVPVFGRIGYTGHTDLHFTQLYHYYQCSVLSSECTVLNQLKSRYVRSFVCT